MGTACCCCVCVSVVHHTQQTSPSLSCLSSHLYQIPSVGQHKLDTSTHVPPAFRDKITLTRYESLEVCREALHSRGFKIYGVEISSDAKDINDEPFDGSAAFIMGNEVSRLVIPPHLPSPSLQDCLYTCIHITSHSSFRGVV